MSQDNVEIVRQSVNAWNHRDRERLIEICSEEMEWRPANPAAIEDSVYRGRAEVRARGRSSGVEPTQQFSDYVSLSDGKIIGSVSFPSWREGLKAAGLAD
jgi:hypothetical protein